MVLIKNRIWDSLILSSYLEILKGNLALNLRKTNRNF